MFCQNCLIIVFQDALKALNLYRLCAAYGTTPYRALLPTLGDTSYANDFRSKFRA